MIPDLIGLKAKIIVGLAVLGIISAVFGVQQYRIHMLKEDIKTKDTAISTLSADLAVANANVATLKATTKRQNSAIQALKDQKATLDAQVRSAALEAQKNRQESVSIEGSGVENMNDFFERLFK